LIMLLRTCRNGVGAEKGLMDNQQMVLREDQSRLLLMDIRECINPQR
jgi:hypothetical protein